MASWLLPTALLAGLVLGVSLGVAVIAVGPRRRANRLLGALLILTGTTTWLYGDWGSFTQHPVTVAFNGLASAAISVLYVELLVDVLATPLVAPLRRPWIRAALAVAFAATLVPMGLALVASLRAPSFDADLVYAAQGPALALTLLVFFYAFAASVSAWRRAPTGSASRTRAAHFALAFGVRDGLVVLAIAAMFLPGFLPTFGSLLWPLSIVLSVPLLAYGIVRSQLFDIELRLKEGMRRGTILGALLLGFGLIAIVVERTATRALGVAAGGIGVALLLFAFIPLERFAQRVADRVFPNVSADEAYLSRRKLEVYRATLEDVLARDPRGAVDDPVLVDLRRGLGVTREQHAVLEIGLRPRSSLASSAPEPFEIVSELGRGGFGRALLARDRHLDRYVVLKQPIGLVGVGSAARDMFLREARLAAQIQHPNVVTVHQVIPDRDPPILVLEHVDGESLADRLAREGALAPAEVARLGLDVLAGLDRIHAAGVVHRDLKPGNILIARDGTAKITDFGIAHVPADAATAQALTVTGFIVGSPAYMSPEQARGRPIDARSDLYSLGVVLHEALTGRLPIARDATLGAFAPSVALAPPPAFAPLLDRALDPDPAKRFASAREMSDALRRTITARA